MKISEKASGKALSIPMGVMWGTTAATVVTLIGAGLISKLIDKEWMIWEHMGYAVMILLLAASWIGSNISHRKTKRRRVFVCVITGLVYLIVLMAVTALFFGGQYSGVGETVLLVLCGCMLAALWDDPHRISGKKRHLKRNNR